MGNTDHDTKTRHDYLRDIIMSLETNEVFLPTAAQERSYEEALDHVARVVSNDDVQPYPYSYSGLKRSRKECLKEVLRVLQAMEHRRVYDPPGDSEIGYYLVIRKYVRSLLTFFGSEVQPVFRERSCCFSTIEGLHHLEELAEVRRHLATFSASVSQIMDIKNSYTPLMGIEYRLQQGPPPVILNSSSRERINSSAFYFHKFLLAFFDLRSHSLLFYSPPSMEEKISYLQALDCTPPPTPGTYMVHFSKVDVYSDYSRCLVIERMTDDINDLEKHCLNIIDAIMTKLSLSEQPWNALFERWYRYELNSEAATAALSRELLIHERYDHVPIEDIRAYITHVQRGIRLASQAYYFLSGRFHDNKRKIDFFNNWNYFESEDPSEVTGFCEATLIQGWAIHHAITILNYGSRDDFGELSVLNNPMIQARPERESEREHTISGRKLIKQEEINYNVKRLTGIIEDLNVIGDSDTVPDEEEIQLLHKIWQGVASAVAFYIHALAYEQQESVIKGHPLFGSSGRMKFIKSDWRPGLKPAEERMKDSASLHKLRHQMNNVQKNLMCFCKLLYAVEKGLLEKLETALAEKERQSH